LSHAPTSQVPRIHDSCHNIHTSLSSLQSHVLTSLWLNSYAIREDGWNGAGYRFRRRHRWSETTSFRFVFVQCCYPYL